MRTMSASRHSPRRTSPKTLQSIDVPVLVMAGDDDQIVPIADAALLAVKHLKKGTLCKVYPGLPHGMATTHADAGQP